jgi:hypothetical protein
LAGPTAEDLKGAPGLASAAPPKPRAESALRRGTLRGVAPYGAGEAVPRLAPGQQALPDGIEPSNAQGGRGSIVPYNARVRTADSPYRDKQEAADDAVDLIEGGADRSKVYAQFEPMGVYQSDIEQRGLILGGPAFKAKTNAGSVAPGATDSTMAARDTSASEGVANFGKRVAARSSQAFTGVLAQTGVFGADGIAASLARDQKRLEAAAPGEEIQQELEDLGKVKTYSEIPSALIQNPRTSAMNFGSFSADSTLPASISEMPLSPRASLNAEPNSIPPELAPTMPAMPFAPNPATGAISMGADIASDSNNIMAAPRGFWIRALGISL